MKRLKSILQSSFVYYALLFLSFCSYFVCSNKDYVSLYDDFSNEEFIITNIVLKDYGVKLELSGLEKVLGFLYVDSSEILSFCDRYSIGDRVLISGDESDISNETVPNTFNYKNYLNSNGIYNVISITSIDKVSSSSNIFYKIKNFLLDRGNKLRKSSPYVNSLLFGNNSFIDEDVLSSYRENGISHLFAISGLHISIFVGIFGFFLDKFKVKTVFKYVILIFFLLFYMFLTNFSMSVLRGCILTILLFINKIFDFKISTVNLLLLTLSIIMFFNPLFINNVGLKYSFLVTLFLIVFSDLINRGGKIYSLFMISLISFLCAYPITVNNFYQVNFLSILYNIFFVPFVSGLVIPFVFISYLFPFLDSVLFLFIRILEVSSQFLSSFSLFKISMCKMNVLMIVIYYVVLLKFFSCLKRKKFAFSLVLVMFFVVSFYMPFKSDNYVMFFDVGQGDSALISVGGNYTLIDTGGIASFGDKEYSYKISRNKFLPYFKSVGIRRLDNLILTHGDQDHMKEASYLVQNFDVRRVIFNCGEYNSLESDLIKVLEEKNIKYSSCVRKLDIDDYELKFLYTREYDNENDNSSVIYFDYNNYKFLFMGDAGVSKEGDILLEYDLSDIDFLKVGHHGSSTSSSKDFIDVIEPKYSFISVGKDNRYGHPKEEVLDNLKTSKIYRTDMDGSILIKFDKGGYKLETYSP